MYTIRILTIALAIAAFPASGDEYRYLIYQEGDNLSMISTRLYGTKKFAKDIAKWNNIDNPDYIWLGKRLRVKIEPKLSEEEGDLLVRKMKARLQNKPLAEVPKRIIPPQLRNPFQPRKTPYAKRKRVKEEKSAALIPTAEEIENFMKQEFKNNNPPQRQIASGSADDRMLEDLIRKTNIQTTHTTTMEMTDLVETNSHLLSQFTYQELYDKALKYHKQNKFQISSKYFRICREAMPQFIPCWIYELSSLKGLKDQSKHEKVKNLLFEKHPHLVAIKKRIEY